MRDRIRGLTMGSNDYVGKPYDREYVVARARELLGHGQYSHSKTTVLVVDDNATNRRILEAQLTNWEMKPTGIDKPGAALSSIKQAAASGTPFKLALLDFHMPDIDGLALAEQIKKEPEGSEIRIIIMSSSMQQNQARHRDWSIDAKLLKPVKAAELLSVIRDVMCGDPQSKTQKRQAALESTRPGRVLVAEDNRVNQELIRRLLEKWGHTAIITQNGKDALALLDHLASFLFTGLNPYKDDTLRKKAKG